VYQANELYEMSAFGYHDCWRYMDHVGAHAGL